MKLNVMNAGLVDAEGSEKSYLQQSGVTDFKVQISELSPSSIQRDTSEFKHNEAYEVSYHFRHMLEAASIHFVHSLLGPLALPILYMTFSRCLLGNMLFRLTRWYFFLEFPIWIWVVGTAFMLIFEVSKIEIILPSMITCGIAILLRNIVVSLKYGYYSEEQWKRLKTISLSDKEIQSTLIIPAWLTINEEVAEKELALSFSRLYIKPEKMSLKLKNAPKKFRKMLRKHCLDLTEENENTVSLAFLSK